MRPRTIGIGNEVLLPFAVEVKESSQSLSEE